MSGSEHPNPPAFPSPDERDADGCGIREGSSGMTLRDYFAAHADVEAYSPFATYEMANGRPPTLAELTDYIATIRYLEADAMLAERSTP